MRLFLLTPKVVWYMYFFAIVVNYIHETPQRTPRSARGQIDKLRSIIEAQKMEIQELQDKLKEKSSREVNLLQNEIDVTL